MMEDQKEVFHVLLSILPEDFVTKNMKRHTKGGGGGGRRKKKLSLLTVESASSS